MQRRPMIFLLLILLLMSCRVDEQGDVLPAVVVNSQARPTVVSKQQRYKLPGKLLFVSDGNLWLYADAAYQLLTSSGKVAQAALAPDGSQLAYVQREESYSDVYVRRVRTDAWDEAALDRKVTENEPPGIAARSLAHVRTLKWAFHPAWSPDGSQLAFVSQDVPPSCDGRGTVGACAQAIEWPLSLFLVTRDELEAEQPTGRQQRVLVRPDTDLSHPVWSPDGHVIAFTQAARYPENGSSGLTIGFYDLRTHTRFSVEAVPDGAYDPNWSPDGRWFIFTRRTTSGTNLWLTPNPLRETQAVQPVQLTTDGASRAGVWSPDGAYLAFYTLAGAHMTLQVAPFHVDQAGAPTLGRPQVLVNGKDQPLDLDSRIVWN